MSLSRLLPAAVLAVSMIGVPMLAAAFTGTELQLPPPFPPPGPWP